MRALTGRMPEPADAWSARRPRRLGRGWRGRRRTIRRAPSTRSSTTWRRCAPCWPRRRGARARPLSARAERQPRPLAAHAVGPLAAGSSRRRTGSCGSSDGTRAIAGRLAARARAPTRPRRCRSSRRVPYQFYPLGDLPAGAARGDRLRSIELDPLTRGHLFHRVQADVMRALQRPGRLPLTTRDASDAARATSSTDARPRRRASTARSSRRPSSACGRTRWSRMRRGPAHRGSSSRSSDQAQWEPIAFELAFGLPRDPGQRSAQRANGK